MATSQGSLSNVFDTNRKRKCEETSSNQNKRCCLQVISQNVQNQSKPVEAKRAAGSRENVPRKKIKGKRRLSRSDENTLMAAPITELTPSSTILSCSPLPVIDDTKLSPLPRFDWTDSASLWNLMLRVRKEYGRDASVFGRHPSFQPSMRSMLLDWLNEVCQVYNLHRETYYLALDFFDRYLSVAQNLPKSRLQLLGISCLFLAAKIEEIFPPKLERFSFVCDGACSDSDILAQEMIICQQLQWQLSPVTPIAWLNVYLQNYSNFEKENGSPRKGSEVLNESFLIPDFDGSLFIQIAHLIDLCTLDAGCLNYPYAVIAASALYHFTNESIVKHCTGKTVSDLTECIEWLIPFAIAIKNEGMEFLSNLPSIDLGDNKKIKPVFIQPHTVNLDLLNSVYNKA